MTKHVNYEDDLFYLHLCLKGLASAFKLNLDAELFLDKIGSEILLIDAGTKSLFESLKENTGMIGRLDHLRHLQKLNQAFIRLLEEVLAKTWPLASGLEHLFTRLQAALSSHQSDLKEIKALIAPSRSAGRELDHIVSQEEFNLLLSQEEEEG